MYNSPQLYKLIVFSPEHSFNSTLIGFLHSTRLLSTLSPLTFLQPICSFLAAFTSTSTPYSFSLIFYTLQFHSLPGKLLRLKTSPTLTLGCTLLYFRATPRPRKPYCYTPCALHSTSLLQLFGSAGLAYATAALTVTTLFFGELLPKALGVNNAEVVARRVLPTIILLSVVLSPIAKTFTLISKVGVLSLESLGPWGVILNTKLGAGCVG